MRRILRFCIFIVIVLFPAICFSWGESKHPITELLIQRVYLDTNYVFCGCDAYWGTNVFGLFVFDRRTETWTNYPELKQVKNIEREGDFIYVTNYHGTTLRFNRYDGSHETAPKRKWHFIKGFPLIIDDINYRVYRDSVILGTAPNMEVYIPSSEQIPEPTGHQPIPKNLKPIFSHPVVYENKIYMPYDLGLAVTSTYTEGLGVFDIAKKTFHFYGSGIFRGTVTGSFVYDSLIIFPTARFWYEGNASPAAGFVAFNPTESTFSIWRKLPLPDEPLAIFQLTQDQKEYWIGTDKGVFRIDKSTHETIHYQITKGIVSKDSANVHYSCGGLFGENSSELVTKLDKGKEVEIVAVLNQWCEIKVPKEIAEKVEDEHVVTLWIYMDDLIFHLGGVE